MLIRIVRLPVAPAEVNLFIEYFNAVKKNIRHAEGCHELKLWTESDIENIFFTYSIWESELHLKNYLQSDLFKTTWNKVRPLFYEKPEAWSLREIMSC